MFTFKIGPHTTEVSCSLIEDAVVTINTIASDVVKLNQKVDQLLGDVEGAPRIEFIIGPVSEQE